MNKKLFDLVSDIKNIGNIFELTFRYEEIHSLQIIIRPQRQREIPIFLKWWGIKASKSSIHFSFQNNKKLNIVLYIVFRSHF